LATNSHMRPENEPPFFVPDQNQNAVKSQATRSIPMPNTCRSQVCLDRHWPNSTNQPAQQLLYKKTIGSYRNARLVSIQTWRRSFAIH
jgi:hypothetical protein